MGTAVGDVSEAVVAAPKGGRLEWALLAGFDPLGCKARSRAPDYQSGDPVRVLPRAEINAFQFVKRRVSQDVDPLIG